MKKKKVIRKRIFKSVNIKMSPQDCVALHKIAKKYAGGNMSAWLRHAGLRYVPKRDEKVSAPKWGMFPKKK